MKIENIEGFGFFSVAYQPFTQPRSFDNYEYNLMLMCFLALPTDAVGEVILFARELSFNLPQDTTHFFQLKDV